LKINQLVDESLVPKPLFDAIPAVNVAYRNIDDLQKYQEVNRELIRKQDWSKLITSADEAQLMNPNILDKKRNYLLLLSSNRDLTNNVKLMLRKLQETIIAELSANEKNPSNNYYVGSEQTQD